MTIARAWPAILLISAAACTTALPPAAAPQAHGMTIGEEATVIRLEDRREFDARVAQVWLSNSNALHRQRIALALGRIGPSTFVDNNDNGVLDPGELHAGVTLLESLVTDPDIFVRRTAAFSLGEIGDPAALDTLFELTGDEHADVAAEAVEAISKMATEAPLGRYLPLTAQSVREAVRARAVRFLFRFDNDAASQAASDLLADPSVTLRREASYALSRRGFTSARPQLELLLNDSDAPIRSYVARALARIADPASLPRLFAATTDPDPWVRTEVARAIGQIGTKMPASIQGAGKTNDALRLIALTQDSDPGTRAVSIDTLGLLVSSEPLAKVRILELASNGSKWERERAAAAIAGQLPDAQDSPLTTILTNADTGIKRAVLDATSAIPSGIGLRKRFAGDPDPTVRASAVGDIPDASIESEIDLIRTALADPDPIVRANAIERFGAWKTAPPAKALKTLLEAEQRAGSDSLDDARLSAIAAIGAFDSAKVTAAEMEELHFGGVEGFLRALLQDHDPVVRRNAADLIATSLKLPRAQYTPLAIDQLASYYEDIVRWSREKHTARIHLARGNIDVVLLTQDAPMTTKNFADLARKGYFDNTSFMRVVPDFVIQGGDPRNDMSGGPGYAIRDEINMQKYTRGAVGMALSGPDTGGSQYFITHSPQPHLDGGYTIFARVTGGMDEIVDHVERGDKVLTITIDDPPS